MKRLSAKRRGASLGFVSSLSRAARAQGAASSGAERTGWYVSTGAQPQRSDRLAQQVSRQGLGLGILALLVLAGCRDRPSSRDEPSAQQNPRGAEGASRSDAGPSAVVAKPAFAYLMEKGRRVEVSISDIAERAVRSVVNIRAEKVGRGAPALPFNHPFFPQPPRQRAQSLGSGVVVTADGIVLTNHHVVSDASEIRVSFADEREFAADLVGSDPKSDVAVLRIKPRATLDPLPLGDSTKLRLGEVVLAVGNPFGVGQTVTMGIVSAVGRANVGIVDYEDFIQTDAAINPGNSGGALINMRGELVGINTAIVSRSGGYQGIGFAIPTAMARSIMESLVQHGKVVRGWLGVAIQELTEELAKGLGLPAERGVLVSDVQPNSPADRGGIRRRDVITAIDGVPVHSPARLRNVVASAGANKTVKVKLLRDQSALELSIQLGELPSDEVASVEPSQGALGGLSVETLTDDQRRRHGLPPQLQGVLVSGVAPRSAARAAGLRAGDVILELNRLPVRDARQFQAAYSRAQGDRLLMLVYRDGSAMYLLVDR